MSADGKRYRWRVIDAVEESELPPIARHLMHVLCGRADMDTGELGEHSPSLTLLAALTGWSRRVVMGHLNILEDGKWLIRDRPEVAAARSKKERTRYAVRIPSEPPLSGSSRAPHALVSGSSRAPDAPALGHQTTGARAPGAHASDQSDHSDPHAVTQRARSSEQPAAPLTPAAEMIKSKTDATAAEATAIAADWAARPGIRNASAVLRSKTPGELQAEVRRYREANKPTPIPDGPPPKVPGVQPPKAYTDAAERIRTAAAKARRP